MMAMMIANIAPAVLFSQNHDGNDDCEIAPAVLFFTKSLTIYLFSFSNSDCTYHVAIHSLTDPLKCYHCLDFLESDMNNALRLYSVFLFF